MLHITFLFRYFLVLFLQLVEMNLFTNNTIIYFVVYVIYFLGLVVGALIIDRLGLMDGIVEKLGESAHRFFLKYELDIYRGEREVILHSLDSEDDLNSKGIFHGCLASVGLAKVAPQSESKVPDSVSKVNISKVFQGHQRLQIQKFL